MASRLRPQASEMAQSCFLTLDSLAVAGHFSNHGLIRKKSPFTRQSTSQAMGKDGKVSFRKLAFFLSAAPILAFCERRVNSIYPICVPWSMGLTCLWLLRPCYMTCHEPVYFHPSHFLHVVLLNTRYETRTETLFSYR